MSPAESITAKFGTCLTAPSLYSWRAVDSHDPILKTAGTCKAFLYRRPALASEHLWYLKPQCVGQLFLEVSLTLNKSVSKQQLQVAARKTWKTLRLQCPEIGTVKAAKARETNETVKGKTVEMGRWVECWVMPNEVASGTNEEELEQKAKSMLESWQRRTMKVEFGSEWCFEQLREHLIRVIRDEGSTDAAWCYVRGTSSETGHQEEIIYVKVMLCLQHLITDGIGIRIVMGKFLEVLASHLAGEVLHASKVKRFEFNGKKQVLAPTCVLLMNEEQRTIGSELEEGVRSSFKFLLEDVVSCHIRFLFRRYHLFIFSNVDTDQPRNWGLPVETPTALIMQYPESEFCTVSLSQAESSLLLSCIKSVLGPTATITHLCHAAVMLALLRFSPLDSEGSDTLHSPLWLNARSRLRRNLGTNPVDDYIPICQAMGQIIFENLATYCTTFSSPSDEVRNKLHAACKVATVCYMRVKNRMRVFAENVVLMEYLGDIMAAKSDKPAGDEEIDPSKDRKFADPFVLSDGLGEKYVHHQYFQDEKTIFRVDTLRFVANAEGPNLLSSWRGIVSLSGEWKKGDYSRRTATDFLEDVKSLMLLLPT